MRDSIVFYRSFYEAIKEAPDDVQLKVFWAIMEYGLNGTEMELTGVEKIIFTLIKPQIDANNKRASNGAKGGRRKTNGCEDEKPLDIDLETNGCASEKPMVTNSKTNGYANEEPNVNVNDNVNVNENVDIKESIEKSSRFSPPTRQDVQEYCLEKGYTNVDVERFIDFYSCKGWMVGKNKMEDWKAAVRNWNRSQRQESTTKGSTNKFINFNQREYDYDNLEKQLLGKKSDGGST